ncbi:DUF4139 domain-containing protein [Sphingosinicella rhizophila]|uniref:DUF4139 domain-containing protein n=1 Tax=Sphingosinicella rhizophila TaxID=3050082 RepID=A0ABU3QBX4_9SPHN|nr:DUF4139 domain-containing protein [Sphingosinicella sp. GR2756]MDT9600903.1 DUF4139 domain-containing protein [Sphingosinicella sp. GR2756]
MRRILLLSTLLAAPVLAQSGQGNVSITIYNNDLALVQDTRQLDVPVRRSKQEFPDVSGMIRPETVTLTGDGIGIVEQNFDYDLLSPQALMQKAVGEMITLVRTNPATGQEMRERATVLAVNGGVVLRIGERIEVLRDDGLPVRVIFDKVPENLRARPTLSVTMESARSGTRPVTLSYLTPGIGWKADYVTMFDERAGKIDVQGWITLSNNTGTTYANADTLLVAGQVRQDQGYDPRRSYRPPPPPPSSIRNPGTETAGRERLGDFYLYPLAERTTIANQQTKQVSFLDVVGAPGRKAYEYRNGWLDAAEEARSADTVLKFSTSREQGLGDALPAGIVRVYMRDARGNAQFIGESAIGHTPMGSELGLKTGEAFDVKVKPVVEKRERIDYEEWKTTERFRIKRSDGAAMTGESDSLRTTTFWRTSMRYTLTNARPESVTVDLTQAGLDNYWGDTRIISESLKSERRSADQAVWRVTVPANGTTVVTAVFDTRY